MKTYYSTCLAFAAITIISIAAGCSGAKTLATSTWQSQPVVIDGNMDDWQQPLRYANADTRVNYSFTNDGEKLYLCLLTVDRRAQSKIMLGGLQIKIQDASAGKDEKVATLIYPIGGSITFPKPDKDADPNKRPDMQQIIGQASSLQVSGFPFAQVETELPLLNKYGVNVAMNFTKDDRLIYEASIPVKDLGLKDKDVSITIILKGMPKDKTYYKNTNQTGTGSGMANGMGQGGLGMRGYGSGGGMGGYGGGYGGGYAQSQPRMNTAYTAMFADQRIHLKTRLANQ